MTFGAALTCLVIVAALGLMMANVAGPDVVLLGAVVVLATAGVLDPGEAFGGFANPGMLTVAALFVLAAGLRETGAVVLLTSRILGRPRSARGALLRMVPPVLVGSAFLNNTTIVASLLPAVHDWSRRIGIPASRLLLPLSYASILGGTCTLIGTSTNLVVAGLVVEALERNPGLHAPGMLEVSLIGIPVAVIGGALLVAFGPTLLPDRRPAVSLHDDPRQYTMELLVPPNSRLAGRSIEEAGLRHLPGAFLMEIDRDDRVLAAVDAKEVLQEGDRLVFVGDVGAIVDLQRMPGLAAAPDQVFRLGGERDERALIEAVVSHRSPLVGQTIRDGQFRTRYRAVVIAVARAGERLGGRIGDIELAAGDVLLLEAARGFAEQHRTRTDFYLVSTIEGATPPRWDRSILAMGILAAFVASVAVGVFSTVVGAFLAAGAMVLTRCCTLEEARRSIDLQVLVAIAAAFGLGEAIQVTGLDRVLADLSVAAGADSPWLALLAIYVLTAVLTELVTNNAAAVLALPLSLSMADRLGVSPMPFVFTVMLGASASFLTPIGYQTNLMVYGPGGYRASDYLRAGLPLSLVAGVSTLLFAPYWWPF